MSRSHTERRAASFGPLRPDPRATVRDLVAVLFRRGKLLLGVFTVILGAAGFGLALDPPWYFSEVKLLLESDPSGGLQTEIELLRSRELLERVARETLVPRGAAENELARAVTRLRRDLTVEAVTAPGGATNLLRVRYRSPDRGSVLRVLDPLPRLYQERRWGPAPRDGALEYYQSQLASFERRLQEAERELAEFERQTAASPGLRPRAEQRLSEIAKLRAEAEAGVREAQRRLSDAGTQADLARLGAQLARLRARRAGLIEQERSWRIQVEDSRAEAGGHPARRRELERNLRTAEQGVALYRGKEAELRDRSALESKAGVRFSLIEGPRAPERARQHSAWLYLGLGGSLAAASGIAAALAAEALDRSVHTPRQLERCASLVVLACIPESRQN